MMYIYESNDKRDINSRIVIFTSSRKRAFMIALVKFLEYGFKGSPKLLAV